MLFKIINFKFGILIMSVELFGWDEDCVRGNVVNNL